MPLSLRLQANLMVGVMRVYGQQVNYYCADVGSLWTRLYSCVPEESQQQAVPKTTSTGNKRKKQAAQNAAEPEENEQARGRLSSNMTESRVPSVAPALSHRTTNSEVDAPSLPIPDYDGYDFPMEHVVPDAQPPIIPTSSSSEADVMNKTGKKRRVCKMDTTTMLSRTEMFMTNYEEMESSAVKKPVINRKMQMKLLDEPLVEGISFLKTLINYRIQAEQPQDHHYTPPDYYDYPIENPVAYEAFSAAQFDDSSYNHEIVNLPWSSLGKDSDGTTFPSSPPPLTMSSVSMRHESERFVEFMRRGSGSKHEPVMFQRTVVGRSVAARAFYNLLGKSIYSRGSNDRIDSSHSAQTIRSNYGRM